jgi:transposase
MSYRDQVKYIETLQRFERKMDPKEKEELKMFVKRHKDEEEFDSVSMKRLKEIYDKYNIPVDKSKYDSFFKKIND